MTVLASQDIFTFQRRAQDVRVDIATDAEPGDLSGITFRSVNGSIEKTGLTAESGGNGLLVDFTLSDDDLDVWAGTYRWEMVAEVVSQVYAVAYGWLIVAPEVTEAESSS